MPPGSLIAHPLLPAAPLPLPTSVPLHQNKVKNKRINHFFLLRKKKNKLRVFEQEAFVRWQRIYLAQSWLSPCLWEKANAAAPLPHYPRSVNWIVASKALPGWFPRSQHQPIPPEGQNVPSAAVQSQAVTPSPSLQQLARLLLPLINLIRLIEQAVCRRRGLNPSPAPSEQPSWRCCRCPAAKGMSFLSPPASTFPSSFPSSAILCLAG